MDLLASEIRVLGCLLEKQRTTPDHYPLTLNALRLACNQSTNRDPVVQYDDATIRDALHRLERRGMARFAGAGSRAPKFRHLLAEALPMDDGEQAVMCVLMLRGPQTPGELKQRAERMHPFAGLAEVNEVLERLIGRDLAVRLARRPGQKEERYAHTLAGEEQDAAGSAVGETAGAPTSPAAADQMPTPEHAAPGAVTSASLHGNGNGHAATAQTGAAGSVAPASAPAPAPGAEDLARLREHVSELERQLRRLRRDVQGLQAELGIEPAHEPDAPSAATGRPGVDASP